MQRLRASHRITGDSRRCALPGASRHHSKRHSHSANSSIGVLIYNGFTSETFANMPMICARIFGCFNF
ncbi:hypothetical protein THER5_1887 [Bifidobacterium thermacidophilum subsp. thermacidophilum]|uniref:Uncharacterized protein n=1 Tax=Bifidobacterium thermacidophilum subsp. thermacidophilum TaxID=79262 RepID=A0A087E442_9BIFI|nr:hypothetical protein THER5_1887 [Bifidobacterium thermacidophilum subsp. thermacidophilum]